MGKFDRQSIVQLVKAANIDLDEALIRLWDGGFDEVKDQTTVLSGARLNRAKVHLGIATKQRLTSLAHWQKISNLSEEELRKLLAEFKINVSDNSRTLPPVAIKKLGAFAATRNQLALTYQGGGMRQSGSKLKLMPFLKVSVCAFVVAPWSWHKLNVVTYS